VFLVLLYFATYVLLNLWLTSTVDASAHDAAIDVATSDPAAFTRVEAEVDAVARARASLGSYGSKVTFTFEPSGPGEIVLHVQAPSLRVAPPLVADALDIGGLDRRIVVHLENGR